MNNYHLSTLEIYEVNIKKMEQQGNEQAVEVLKERLNHLKTEKRDNYQNAAKLRGQEQNL